MDERYQLWLVRPWPPPCNAVQLLQHWFHKCLCDVKPEALPLKGCWTALVTNAWSGQPLPVSLCLGTRWQCHRLIATLVVLPGS